MSTPPAIWMRLAVCSVAGSASKDSHGVKRHPPLDGVVAGAWGQAEQVLRGGSWNNNARNVRGANRNNNSASNRNNNIGFRCLVPQDCSPKARCAAFTDAVLVPRKSRPGLFPVGPV